MTHFGPHANERSTATQVAFTVRANDQEGKRQERLEGDSFVGRLMQHVLPTGIKRIRHYGVLASACKGAKLGAARAALQMPVPHEQAQESALDFMARVARRDVQQCPCCKQGRLRCVATLQGLRHLAPPGQMLALPANRGPP